MYLLNWNAIYLEKGVKNLFTKIWERNLFDRDYQVLYASVKSIYCQKRDQGSSQAPLECAAATYFKLP
jgi:hypothetical protein